MISKLSKDILDDIKKIRKIDNEIVEIQDSLTQKKEELELKINEKENHAVNRRNSIRTLG
jgi:septum formation topological specificity factor MinE